MPILPKLLLLIVLLPALTAPACVTSRAKPVFAVEIDVMENRIDGCIDCGCRAHGEFEEGNRGNWWIAFGLVRSDPRETWRADVASSHCGTGSFDSVDKDFRRTVGTPYVLLDIDMAAVSPPAGDADLQTVVRARRLSGFNPKGQPVYQNSRKDRRLGIGDPNEITLPVLVPDEREKEAFGVHEVLLRLRATLTGHEPPVSFGAISVSADVPGSQVLLDGGLVGRIAEDESILVTNVRAGTREIRVRDFSGREASRRVVVEEGKSAEVTLQVLDLPAGESHEALRLIGKNPQGYVEYWRVKDATTVVRIPAGEFLRGSQEERGEPHERPQHRVHVSAFLIDKTEVTWRQMRKYAEATGAPLPPAPPEGRLADYPVSSIIWKEAQEYCEWVGGRLPTEAEWEKAARGTDGRTYPWGEEWDHDRCNTRDGGRHRLTKAGRYRECLSPYGVLDMAGNAWEWCSDWYGETYYTESPARDPTGPAEGSRRVLRGGAWVSARSWARTASRYAVPPTFRHVNHGFRCAQEVPDS